jgi:hypothetical protein
VKVPEPSPLCLQTAPSFSVPPTPQSFATKENKKNPAGALVDHLTASFVFRFLFAFAAGRTPFISRSIARPAQPTACDRRRCRGFFLLNNQETIRSDRPAQEAVARPPHRQTPRSELTRSCRCRFLSRYLRSNQVSLEPATSEDDLTPYFQAFRVVAQARTPRHQDEPPEEPPLSALPIRPHSLLVSGFSRSFRPSHYWHIQATRFRALSEIRWKRRRRRFTAGLGVSTSERRRKSPIAALLGAGRVVNALRRCAA